MVAGAHAAGRAAARVGRRTGPRSSASAVIFGVAYSFAAFFRSFGSEFAAERADVSLVFGLSGLIYFLLGAGAGMLADRFRPRLHLRGRGWSSSLPACSRAASRNR